MPKVHDLMAHLFGLDVDQNIAYTIFTEDDVNTTAKNLGEDISLEEREKIVDKLNDTQEGDYGLCWPMMESVIDAYLYDTDKNKAWLLYCEDAAGDMHVADCWEQLTPHVQQHYLRKIEDNKS